MNYKDYKLIEDFCFDKLNKCFITKNEKSDKNRGNYKGFLYVKKLNYNLYYSKTSYKLYEFYNFLKNQRSEIINIYHIKKGYIDGIVEALYLAMNFIATLFV